MADEDDQGQSGEGGAPPAKAGDGEEKPRPRWPLVVAGLIAVAFVAVVLILVLMPHRDAKTEDAYVTAHYANVAPRVAGQVDRVLVDDNQPVRAGTLLATLDPRDYATSLAQAEAARASDLARVDQATAIVARQPSAIRQAQAQVTTALARLALARADQRRYANLAADGAGTFQQHQQADAQLREAQAGLAQAEAELESQRRQLDALVADREAAVAQVGRDAAAVRPAPLHLGYTRIVAPLEGTIAEKTVQVGNQVAPGAPLMLVVPLGDVYIMADYRELELRHMRPGQPALIHIDSYDIDLRGHVASVAPASGATFSPIPPNNATGNFTKIVQRLPVKVTIDPGQRLARLLRAGMSAEVTVDTGLADVVDAQRRTNGRITAP